MEMILVIALSLCENGSIRILSDANLFDFECDDNIALVSEDSDKLQICLYHVNDTV